MSGSPIKVRRALSRAAVGRYPASASVMLDRIPTSTRAALTSAALAELLDSLWVASQGDKALAIRDAITEGAVWDGERQALREIAA